MILNIMRAMNIIALVMVIVASWVMLVKTFVVSKVSRLDSRSHRRPLTSASSSSLMQSATSLRR